MSHRGRSSLRDDHARGVASEEIAHLPVLHRAARRGRKKTRGAEWSRICSDGGSYCSRGAERVHVGTVITPGGLRAPSYCELRGQACQPARDAHLTSRTALEERGPPSSFGRGCAAARARACEPRLRKQVCASPTRPTRRAASPNKYHSMNDARCGLLRAMAARNCWPVQGAGAAVHLRRDLRWL